MNCVFLNFLQKSIWKNIFLLLLLPFFLILSPCHWCFSIICRSQDSVSDCDGEFMMNGVPRMLWHSSPNIPRANGGHFQPMRSLYDVTTTNQKSLIISVAIILHIWGHLGRGNCCTLGTLGGVNVCYCWLLPPVHNSLCALTAQNAG